MISIDSALSRHIPAFEQVQGELTARQLSIHPAELHGGICGLMCSKSLGPNWLSVLMSDSALAEPDRQSVLSQLFATTRAQFEAPEFGLELLLPDDAVALSDRTESLLAWCQGFLGGFGLADIQFELSEESSEALADMAKIAGTEVGLEDPDADELALTEILEFIRVVAMILYNECAQVHSNQQRLN